MHDRDVVVTGILQKYDFGRTQVDFPFTGSWVYVDCSTKALKYPHERNYRFDMLKKLKDAGWVNYTTSYKPIGDQNICEATSTYQPTEKGKPFVAIRQGTSTEAWTVEIFDLDKITGIADSGGNVCTVEYAVKALPTLIGPTIFGKAPTAPRTSAAVFTLYDDGWRIVQR